MSLISDLLTGGAGTIVEAVVKGVGELVTTDKERLAAEHAMAELGVRREEAYLADTQDARHLQVAALHQDDRFAKRFIYWFAIAWSAFAMGFMLLITLVNIPSENLRMVDTILGFLLGSAIASIFNFFLGTSVSSRHKDDTISALSKG